MFLLVCFVVVLTAVVWMLISPNRRIKKFGDKLPGPKAYPIIGNTYLVRGIKDGRDALELHCKLFKEYGDTYRAWIGNRLSIITKNADHIEKILRCPLNSRKSVLYQCFESWLGQGIFTVNGEKWFRRKKAFLPAFHCKILEQFIKIFNKEGDTLVKCLRAELGKPHFDLQPYMHRLALDIVCESTMGTEMKVQDNPDSEYLSAISKIGDIFQKRMLNPWLLNEFLFSLSGLSKLYTEVLRFVDSFTQEVIRSKREALENPKLENKPPEQPKDEGFSVMKKTPFLELLLEIAEKSDTQLKGEINLRDEVNTLIFGGHDSTATTFSFAFHVLAKHQDVQAQVYEEIRRIGEGRCDFTYQNLLEMKYLERVIKEVLRLYPPLVATERELAEDIQLEDGSVLPRGSSALVYMYFLHRNPKYYEKPEEFNPDNFLPEKIAERHHYSYIPFSGGARTCLGQRFAMLELKLVIAKVLMQYKIAYAGPEWDIILNPVMMLRSSNGFHIRLEERSNATL